MALVSSMQRDLVDDLGWFTQDEFQKGMTLSQLAPGPLAAQMSFYFGWCERGWSGAFLTGLCFITPSFLMVLVIAVLYVKFSSLPWIRSAFLGIAPMIVAIVILGVKKLATKNLKKVPALWIIALGNAILTFFTHQENLWVFLLSGALYLLSQHLERRRAPMSLSILGPFSLFQGIHEEATRAELGRLFLFFLKSGAFVFGSGLAIVPFLRGGVVSEFHWLSEAQFLDAVAIAMITPGPVVITVGFIGYLVAGVSGAVLAAVGVFAPCYFFTVIPAPFFNSWTKRPQVIGFIQGITGAAIGAILGAVGILAQDSLHSTFSFVILILGIWIILRTKIPEPLLILGAGLIGTFYF